MRSSAITGLLYRFSRDANIHDFHAGADGSRCPQPRCSPTSTPGPHRPGAPAIPDWKPTTSRHDPSRLSRLRACVQAGESGRQTISGLPDGATPQITHPHWGTKMTHRIVNSIEAKSESGGARAPVLPGPVGPRRSRTDSPLHEPEKVRDPVGTAGYKSVPARRRDKSVRLLRHVPCVGQVQRQPPGWLNPREPQQPSLATTLPGPGPLPGRQRSKSSATTPIPPGDPGLCHAIRQEVVSEACSGNTGRTYSPAAL